MSLSWQDIHHTLEPMSLVLALLFGFMATPFESKIEEAFSRFQNNDWTAAAAALDAAYAEHPARFGAKNFHYLRGRVAQNQGDWQKAREEFTQAASNNPLYPVASWRAALASAKLHDDAATTAFLALLPSNFPRELKLQVAQEA